MTLNSAGTSLLLSPQWCENTTSSAGRCEAASPHYLPASTKATVRIPTSKLGQPRRNWRRRSAWQFALVRWTSPLHPAGRLVCPSVCDDTLIPHTRMWRLAHDGLLRRSLLLSLATVGHCLLARACATVLPRSAHAWTCLLEADVDGLTREHVHDYSWSFSRFGTITGCLLTPACARGARAWPRSL